MKLFEVANNTQERVKTGAANQDRVWADLQSKFGDNITKESMAKKSSDSADLVCMINGKRVQFEIKGRQNSARWNSAMDVRMGGKDSEHDNSRKVPEKLPIINKAIHIITNGEFTTLRDYILNHQKEHKKLKRRKGNENLTKMGFAGDHGVAEHGSMQIKAPDNTISKLVPILRNLWKQSGDDYVVTVLDDKITYYKISGINVVPGAKNTLPIKAVQIETAGQNNYNKSFDIMTTRVGLKFQM